MKKYGGPDGIGGSLDTRGGTMTVSIKRLSDHGHVVMSRAWHEF